MTAPADYVKCADLSMTRRVIAAGVEHRDSPGMESAERLAWLGLALIHFLPAAAAFRPGGIGRLYGVTPGGTLALLLEHRSLLFAAVVVLCVWSALDPQPRPAAAVATGISVLGYLVLYARHGWPAGPMRTIAKVDLLALPLLGFVCLRMILN